jgi:hypothetical protein
MEPIFASTAAVGTVTALLQSQIDAATATLPPAHRQPPRKGEIVQSKEAALQRLQDWAFTHGFALVTESSNAERVVYQCSHHKKKTRNSRKTSEEDRIRVQTTTQSRGCPFTLYISKQKRLNGQ